MMSRRRESCFNLEWEQPMEPLLILLMTYLAIGKTGSISTGTLFNLSNVFFIGGRITAYLFRIAFAFSYEPSASIVNNSLVSLRTPGFTFAGSMLKVPAALSNFLAASSGK